VALTPKQQAFVREYLIDLNATQAAIRAGYSERTARSIGQENLTKPDIASAVAAAQQTREERATATSTEVLREINRMAMFDPADLTNVRSPDDIKTLPEDVRRAIVGWGWDRNGNFTVKTAKESALEMMARHHSLFNDKLKVEANVKGQVAYKANIPPR
jgi:phage terminase small subunit